MNLDRTHVGVGIIASETVWKALTKKRSLEKTKKSRELKAKTANDCPYCDRGNTSKQCRLC
jgi:hypothetical protein